MLLFSYLDPRQSVRVPMLVGNKLGRRVAPLVFSGALRWHKVCVSGA
jgi:hypothetical protein